MEWLALTAVCAAAALVVLIVVSRRDERRRRKAKFVRRVGSAYGYGDAACGHIDRWRGREFPALARIRYMDYAGAALASASQLDGIRADSAVVVGNPHSSLSSRDEARSLVRSRFGLPESASVIWTSGATDGLRLIATHFLSRGIPLAYHVESHTSVVGTRRVAIDRECPVHCVSDWSALPSVDKGLAIVTAESNVDGRVSDARVARRKGWTVCLDAAKAAATARFEMPECADFAVVSFYKLFGAPTGLGAVLASRQGGRALLGSKRTRSYFGGGSIDRVSPAVVDWTVVKNSVEDAFADGTPHFRGIAQLGRGFAELDRVGGIDRVAAHAGALADELARRLPLEASCIVYDRRPGSSLVVFNVVRGDSVVSPSAVCAYLAHRDVVLRSGCLCNAGACARLLGLEHADFVAAWERGAACGSADDIAADGRPLGVLRASFGKESVWEDLDDLVQILADTFCDDSPSASPAEPRRLAQKRQEEEEYRLDEIMVYPVKGCRPMRPSRWPLDPNTGRFRHDREFAIIDETLDVVVTAKTHANVALVDASVDDRALTLSCGSLRAVVSLDDLDDRPATVRVCGSDRTCDAASSRVSTFFSNALLGVDDRPFRLVRAVRETLANSAPLLLVTSHAVARLNRELKRHDQPPVTPDHFRPNLLLSNLALSRTADPHAEDAWTSLAAPQHDLSFDVLGPCDRCSAIDVDPATATKPSDTLRVLASYRLKQRTRAKVTFGVFLRLRDPDPARRGLLLGRGDRLVATASALVFRGRPGGGGC